MPGTSNFLQWDPGAVNQESDVSYSGDSQRSGGATSGAIFASALANKLFYQLTIAVAALMQELANKGYSPNDGSAAPGSAYANLQAVLAHIVTDADLQNGSSPYMGMQVANPAINDNSHLAANTNFVRVQNYVDSTVTTQRVQAGNDTPSGGVGSVTFPVPFSSTPHVALGNFFGSANIQTRSASGFTYAAVGSNPVDWIAVGPR